MVLFDILSGSLQKVFRDMRGYEKNRCRTSKTRCGTARLPARAGGVKLNAMKISYTVQIWQEDGQYVAHAMPLDVASCGATAEEARRAVDEAVSLFLSTAAEHGTLGEVLEDAGYRYDSTFGYNDAVGFRAGTTSAYVPLGASKLFELPLHIQDTALFYGRRMNLSRTEAARRCEEVLAHVRRIGGVATILWHDRSAGPERQWGWLYRALLDDFRSRGAWITSAGNVVDWFAARRAVRFSDVQVSQDRVTVQLSNVPHGAPGLQVRLHDRGLGGIDSRAHADDRPIVFMR